MRYRHDIIRLTLMPLVQAVWPCSWVLLAALRSVATTFGAEPTPAFQSDDLDFIGGEEETRILSTGKAAWWACGFAKSLRHLQRSLMAFVTVC